jgi:hypothetical protein
MDFMTWQEMFGSGVGIGMGRRMPAALIREDLILVPNGLLVVAHGLAMLPIAARRCVGALAHSRSLTVSDSVAFWFKLSLQIARRTRRWRRWF